MERKYTLPQNLVLLISGVPGVGKTTLSNELLKIHKEIRLVEETDIIREILRGYNDYLFQEHGFLQNNRDYEEKSVNMIFYDKNGR